MKFKLSRKRKKRYKRDMGWRLFKGFLQSLNDSVEEKNIEKGIALTLLLANGPTKLGESWYKIKNNRAEWEWFYFKRRVEVRCAEVFVDNPTNDNLLSWYKEHYPKDKLSHHYCMENRHKWLKYK